MKQHIDFIIDDRGWRKFIFRFYPCGSHVHGFDTETPPTTWDEVYKVYYSWGIIEKHHDGNCTKSERKFYMGCDECSILPDLAAIIRHVMNTGKTYDEITLGQPAGEWRVEKRAGTNYENKPYEFYKIAVFNNWDNTGYRFRLDRDLADEFCKYLDEVNDYMLKHSEVI